MHSVTDIGGPSLHCGGQDQRRRPFLCESSDKKAQIVIEEHGAFGVEYQLSVSPTGSRCPIRLRLREHIRMEARCRPAQDRVYGCSGALSCLEAGSTLLEQRGPLYNQRRTHRTTGGKRRIRVWMIQASNILSLVLRWIRRISWPIPRLKDLSIIKID